MNRFLSFALFFLITGPAHGQDERFYRKIFTDKLFEEQKRDEEAKIIVKSKAYQWDFDRDNIDEQFFLIKRDGQDWFQIDDGFGRILFKEKLNPMGEKAAIQKITAKSISRTTDVYIIHFFEGTTKNPYKESSARLYFLSIDNRDLKTLKLFKGPQYWHENRQYDHVYWNRMQQLVVQDFNQDGVKEIAIHYNTRHKVYFYQQDGSWLGF